MLERRLLILGAGGHGKVVLDIAEAIGCYETIDFLDDGKSIGEEVLGHQIVGGMDSCTQYSQQYTDAIVALGDNKSRLERTKQLLTLGYHLPVLIHPSSSVSDYATIGEGTVIMPMAVVNADACIGVGCIINTGAIIEHDCVVGDGSHITYGAVLSGGAKVGNEVFIESRQVVRRNVVIIQTPQNAAKGRIYPKVKRLIDIILAVCILIGTLPFMLIAALAIKIEDPKGPVIFKQVRVGKNKVPFKIYKFRSMWMKTPDVPTHLLSDPNQFITKTGAFLRKTSIDEVPQVWNILKGNMSFVGPRPALFSQEDLIEERDKFNVHSVRPGLTGLAQVSGRDELLIPVKASYDGKYIEKMCFRLDVSLFFKTFVSVAKSEGVVEGKTDKGHVG